MPIPAPIPTLIRAACAIVDSERNGTSRHDDWHREARMTVERLRSYLRDGGTLRSIERDLGAGNMYLGRLLRDYPWLADGTGFEHRSGHRNNRHEDIK